MVERCGTYIIGFFFRSNAEKTPLIDPQKSLTFRRQGGSDSFNHHIIRIQVDSTVATFWIEQDRPFSKSSDPFPTWPNIYGIREPSLHTRLTNTSHHCCWRAFPPSLFQRERNHNRKWLFRRRRSFFKINFIIKWFFLKQNDQTYPLRVTAEKKNLYYFLFFNILFTIFFKYLYKY